MARIHSDPRATPASTGLDPWRLSKARSDVQGWNDDDLGRALQLLADADAAAKGAAKDPEFQIEKLVSFLSSKGR
jgi:DNA polymerase-3 subunit delta